MPYKNIHFVKIKMELLEDHRFLFQLNDKQKGLYLMLLGLAGKTNNKICDDIVFIKGRLNLKEIEHSDLEKISEVYPKFCLSNGFWEFNNFNKEHNQIFGISQGYPKDTQRIEQKQKENKKQKKGVSNDDFLKTLKQNTAYKHIDIESELAKMDAWLQTKPGRKKSQRFILGWLNRIEKPIERSSDNFGKRKLVL